MPISSAALVALIGLIGLNPTLMTPGAIELTSLCSSRACIRFDFRYLGVWTENWRSIVINHFHCFIAPGSRVVDTGGEFHPLCFQRPRLSGEGQTRLD